MVITTSTLIGCSQGKDEDKVDTHQTDGQISFGEEVELLKKHYQPVVLEDGPRKISVIPELQGRVMTATAAGNNAASFGWINHKYLAGPHTERNATIGGADRLSLGPEAGPYSVFFEPGAETIADNIKYPEAISILPYDLINQSGTEVSVRKSFLVTNHQGYVFDASVERRVSLFSKNDIGTRLGITVPDTVSQVAYSSETSITNMGQESWKKQTGLLSLWSLGAFKPSDFTTVVIPMRAELERVTDYFNEAKASHTKILGTHVYYKADANYMNKIGIPPENTLPIMGSYDASRELLTIITFTVSEEPSVYVNSVWDWEADPYAGEIVNVFNDGLLPNGERFGPLYEMESSSAAKELSPGETQSHTQSTYHFQGDEDALSQISKMLLGVDLATIKSAFLN